MLPVIDVMTRPVITVRRTASLRSAAVPLSDDTVAVGVQKLLDNYTGRRRWFAQVREGSVTMGGRFDDESERRIADALARTIPGIREVRLGARDERDSQ